MALCREYQIPHSHFLGGPNRWTTLDREKGLAYEFLLREQCPECGSLEEDWRDQDGKPLAEPVYTPVSRQCPGCAEVARMRKELPDHMQGVHISLIPLAHLDDEDDQWHTPVDNDAEVERLRQAKLEQARSMGG